MKEIFQIIPAGSGSLWFLAVLAAILLALAAFLCVIAVSARSSTVELDAIGITIHSAFYGRTIPWSSVLGETAMPVDLTRRSHLAPSIRTNGIGLPGYGAGWFRLRNGNKALAFLSDRTRVAYIPTRDYSLLLSVENPGALVLAVKRRAAASQ